MEKSAKPISDRKFQRLSHQGRHGYLARLALDHLEKGDVAGFQLRYAQLQNLVEMDIYHPPSWLDPREALMAFVDFHAGLSGRPHPLDQGNSSTTATHPPWQPAHQVWVAVDQVRSPYNLGNIIRLVDNFSLAGLIHSRSHFNLNHPQFLKAARGCEAWIPARKVDHLPDYLKNCGLPAIGLEVDSQAVPLPNWQPVEPCILVVGHESQGISQSVRACCKHMVYIPMSGFKRSMNVSAALAVAAYHLDQKLAKPI